MVKPWGNHRKTQLFDIKAERMDKRFTAQNTSQRTSIAMSRLAFAGSGVVSQKVYGNTNLLSQNPGTLDTLK